nr:transposase [uncultured Desulfobulbus sp.]
MFIRQTKTSNAASGEAYYTFRLVASERIEGKVRQRTLLNLGSNFSLAREHWPELCTRIEQILSGQMSLMPAPSEIEPLAQRYAARLSNQNFEADAKTDADYQEVDVNSLELVRPRSIGVEHVGKAALNWLDFANILAMVGLNGVQQAAAIGSVIGRMAAPGSELSTWHWLRERSGLGELLDVDFEAMPLMRLYRTSDLLVKHRQTIEEMLFQRIDTLFSLPSTVTLYDLTNTYFEGEMGSNHKAKRGHSKEKRSDCPLVPLGLVLDGSGFVRRSRMFAGNVVEGTTLAEMLEGLNAPASALVIMDRGIATEENITWLVDHQYRYLVVSRERVRKFDANDAVETSSACGQTIRIQRVLNEEGTEARLYCHSEERQNKEEAINQRFYRSVRAGVDQDCRWSEQTAHHQGPRQAVTAHRPPGCQIPWCWPALSHRADPRCRRHQGHWPYLGAVAGRGQYAHPSRRLLPAHQRTDLGRGQVVADLYHAH